MQTLTFANQKGGVGKSAISCQFAYYLAQRGQRVLFLDFDHQQNSSRPLRKNNRAACAAFTTSQLLSGNAAQPGPLPHQSDHPDHNIVIIPGDDLLSTLERQPDKHNGYVNTLNTFIESVSDRFDVCLIDTNPNPDIRYAAALITSNFVLSPIQLNQEAIYGIGALLTHQRYGYRKIKAALNPGLELIGILPNLVEPTPFQRGNFKLLVESYSRYLIPLDATGQQFAFIPKRSSIAEAQAEGAFLADIKKTAARDAWREIKPAFDVIAQRMGLAL